MNTPISKEVPLDTHIIRGSGKDKVTIEKVTLRKPGGGELRGLTLTNVQAMDVNSLIKLIPRISEPKLTELEVAAMDAADISACGLEISLFLVQKATLVAAGLSTQ